MVNYEQLYHVMFNAVTDGLRCLEQGEWGQAMMILAAAQCRCEEMYVDEEQNPVAELLR